MADRFILIENDPEFPVDEKWNTCWYWDTKRPGNPDNGDKYPYTAIECSQDKNPNTDVVYHEKLSLLFTDQAEYYAVCPNCRAVYGGMQWSGSTRGGNNWRRSATKFLERHQSIKGWCQFCDPVFGNGGWCI